MTRPKIIALLFGFVFGMLGSSACKHKPASQPVSVAPFRYRYSTEELKDKYSEDMMKRAAAELKEMNAVNAKGRWKPTWNSIDRHEAPEWYRDAKLVVIVNWSLAAVPSWDLKAPKAMYPDAYGSLMYDIESHRNYHARTWGKDFQYDDFFPLFTASDYDPDGMAALLQEAGARYVILLCKHHDGIAWWDSAWTQRNFVQMGPRRDLLTPLMEALRRRGMKAGLYFTWEEYANVTLGDDGKIYERVWPVLDHKPATLRPLTDANRRRVSGNIAVRNYFDQYIAPLAKEMIDRFDPDGLWMDGEWCAPPETLHSREVVAYLYNHAEGRKEVCTDDRFGIDTRSHHGNVYMNEFYSSKSLQHSWEALRGLSNSFAYNHEDTDEDMLSPQELVEFFVDTISHNGNLNLVVGPDPTGKIPDLQADRLRALGRWIKVNAEAVYGSRALAPYAEGDVCYTRSKDGRFAYAICKKWPGQRLTLKGLHAQPGAQIQLLGVAEPLAATQTKAGLAIQIPDSLQDEKARPCQFAWVVRIPVQR